MDYINKISELAKAVRLPIENNDYTITNKVIDLLYKFTPEKWTKLGETFPSMNDVLNTSVPLIKQMNSFLGIDLSVAPWQGMNHINIAWIIPILAGVTQFLSTKVMTVNQPQSSGNESDMAKQMVEYTRNQILNQSGTAMLAQANSNTQLVLSLLR